MKKIKFLNKYIKNHKFLLSKDNIIIIDGKESPISFVVSDKHPPINKKLKKQVDELLQNTIICEVLKYLIKETDIIITQLKGKQIC